MSVALVESIRDGTFPDDEAILSSQLDASLIPSLLEEITSVKSTLSQSITQISSNEAADVDGWIAQARQVKTDIAKSKDEAREILLEHEALQLLRDNDSEAQAKVSLLEHEIAFNNSLTTQIELISKISQALTQADAHIQNRDLVVASLDLPPLRSDIDSVQGQDAQSLLLSVYQNICQKLVEKLQQETDNCFFIQVQPNSIALRVHVQGSPETTFAFDHILNALDRMQALELAEQRMTDHLTKIILPHLHPRSRSKLTSAHTDEKELVISLAPSATVEQVLDTASAFFSFLHNALPSHLSEYMTTRISAKVAPVISEQWLTPAIPLDLHSSDNLVHLRTKTEHLISVLRDSNSSSIGSLQSWLDSIPSIWLNKRRMASLDAVRKAFSSASGTTRQVERVEKQTFTAEPDVSHHSVTDDEWNDTWGDDDPDTNDSAADDASDAWGFDTDNQDDPKHSKDPKPPAAVDEEGDAWGWGDEDESSMDAPSRHEKSSKNTLNGTTLPAQPKKEEVILTEHYTITDIPDYVLEQIGRDNADTQAVLASPQDFFLGPSTSLTELQSLPVLVLSMFRAIAPTTYTGGIGNLPMLSAMNLYNDALYLSQRLSEHPELTTSFETEIHLLNKFARLTYTNELSTQRQILSDLLDNAQGFIDCTREPNATVCENAVSSTIDYLRSLHKQWASILSLSHTSQSIGSLLSSIMSKMIKDIEDIEDISEAQSQKLLSYMEHMSKVEDLFMATPHPGAQGEQHDSITTIALHAPSYLRFQYLQQILDSSLVDIKYLWTDAGLRLEFSADEVIDLIKALFADSSHRRSAINTIRS